MADPLEGCRAKIERAKEHFRNLYAEFQAFMSFNPYGIASYDNPQTGERVYLAKVSQKPPVRWGVIAGEIVHHLRSALDHLAWQLVLDNGGSPKTGAGGTEFPISWDSNWFETTGCGKVKGASNTAVRYIENLQPYRAGDSFELHPLYVLHHLDVRDKHQVLNIVVGAFQRGTLTYIDTIEDVDVRHFEIGGSEPISPLKDGAEIFRHPIGEETSEVNVQGQFTFEISFEQSGPAHGEPLIPTLNMLISAVDQLITMFRPSFKQDSS